MKKSIITVLLVAVMAFSLVACGGNTGTSVSDVETKTENETANNNAEVKTERVTVSGSFVVTVREVIPDYCLDDFTPTVAVVTEFQGPPFVLYVGGTIGAQLNVGETYVFSIHEFAIDCSKEELQKCSVAAMEMLFPEFQVTDFRLATEEEIGLDSLQLTIEDAKE